MKRLASIRNKETRDQSRLTWYTSLEFPLEDVHGGSGAIAAIIAVYKNYYRMREGCQPPQSATLINFQIKPIRNQGPAQSIPNPFLFPDPTVFPFRYDHSTEKNNQISIRCQKNSYPYLPCHPIHPSISYSSLRYSLPSSKSNQSILQTKILKPYRDMAFLLSTGHDTQMIPNPPTTLLSPIITQPLPSTTHETCYDFRIASFVGAIVMSSWSLEHWRSISTCKL